MHVILIYDSELIGYGLREILVTPRINCLHHVNVKRVCGRYGILTLIENKI